MERLVVAALAVAVATPALAYEVADVPDAGTITGKITYTGAVPTRKIIVTKDKATCGENRDDPEVVVGPDKGVEGAVVYLKDVQKGKPFEKPAKTPEIVNHNCSFVPHVQAIQVGGVVIVNSDPVMHNTHGFQEKQTVFNVAMPMKDQRVEKKVSKPGMMRVECDTHGWMLAWVFAAENPYHAVTGKDGTFKITGVPPGSYTAVAWQEYTGPNEVPVSVKSKEATTVNVELKKSGASPIEQKR
jgi:hypothetical protein